MAKLETEAEPQIEDSKDNEAFLEALVELSKKSFDTFCDDISGMFDVEMKCAQQPIVTETVKNLKKHFGELTAVYSVKAEGILGSAFQIVFDRGGLFTLSGVILMCTEQVILEKSKDGSLENAGDVSNALAEAGDALVGSWDRAFRGESSGHSHFTHTGTFIGNPSDEPEKNTGLPDNEELTVVPYEMTIEPYPPFKCGVVFPAAVFATTDVSMPERVESTEEDPPENRQQEADGQQTAVEEAQAEESDAAVKKDGEESPPQEAAEKLPAGEDTKGDPPENRQQEADGQQAAVEEAQAEESDTAVKKDGEESPPQEADEKPPAEEDTEETIKAEKAVEKAESPKEKPAAGKKQRQEMNDSEERPVSETIQKMTQSAAALPGEGEPPATAESQPAGMVDEFPTICAKDIMQKGVIWAAQDDTVQTALTQMEQHNINYVMIGTDGVLEAIVSRPDLKGAVSTYLRPEFARWRRPLDDATLQIKLKWVMSKPACTATPQTPLADVMEDMNRLGLCVLPVVDKQNKVQGLVTVFDILKVLLKSNTNTDAAGKAPK